MLTRITRLLLLSTLTALSLSAQELKLESRSNIMGLRVCGAKSRNCPEDERGLILRATLIKQPDAHWIIEIPPGVSRAEILKRMDDLGCGEGDEHFVHAIERQFVGAKIAHAPAEFRRLSK